uniref:HDC12885 n=1 Tax=Drosophila melanogaster TaxID=7227 RepID=Q6IKC1_DROME|nr:TPA_inf: HDC12885 [Drosophila melanogaster]
MLLTFRWLRRPGQNPNPNPNQIWKFGKLSVVSYGLATPNRTNRSTTSSHRQSLASCPFLRPDCVFKAKRRGDVAVIDDLCQLPPRHNIQILCIHSSLVAGEPPPVLAAHETLVRGVPLKEGTNAFDQAAWLGCPDDWMLDASMLIIIPPPILALKCQVSHFGPLN